MTLGTPVDLTVNPFKAPLAGVGRAPTPATANDLDNAQLQDSPLKCNCRNCGKNLDDLCKDCDPNIRLVNSVLESQRTPTSALKKKVLKFGSAKKLGDARSHTSLLGSQHAPFSGSKPYSIDRSLSPSAGKRSFPLMGKVLSRMKSRMSVRSALSIDPQGFLPHMVRFFGTRLLLIFSNEILAQILPTLAEFIKYVKFSLQICQIF